MSTTARRLLWLAILWFSVTPLIARQYPPDVPPPTPVTLPAPEIAVLPNGLKVVVTERKSLPLLTLRLVVKAGAEADPPERPGTAQLVASLLGEGTETRSAPQIAEAIDQVGGIIQAGADWDDSFATVSVLKDHTELAFDVLADVVIRPAFVPAEVERQRRQTLSALQVQRDDPAYLADTAFAHLVFLGTPYSHPADGTAAAIGRLTRQDLRDFHARYYRPQNSILAVAGDISAADAFRYAKEFFGSWAQGSQRRSPETFVQAPPPVPQQQIVVIDKPDAVQTEIRVGSKAARRSSPEYNALTVANQVLGGPATNRLFRALRSQHGLTYGASSDLLCYQTTGTWVAKTSTRTSETVRTVQLVLEEMKHLRDHPISRSELDLTQNYLTGHLALDFETAEHIAIHLLELMVYDLPLDYWSRFPLEIRSLSTQEVAGAARQHLNSDQMVIVLVGNATAFGKDLNRLGRVRVIPVGSVDFASASLERPGSGVSAAGSRE